MAICGRCGRPRAGGDVCLSCGVHATATSLVGAQAGSASNAGARATSTYGAPRTDGHSLAGLDRRIRYERAEPEFAALPHWERPFAAERTIWPADSRFGPAATTGDAAAAAAADRGTGRPEQRDPSQPEQHRRAEDVAGRTCERSPGAAQPPESPRAGRWIALTAAMVVVLVTAGTVTVVLQHGWSRQSAPAGKPPVTAAPSSSATTSVAPASAATTSVAPASANQLSVDFAAATAPDGAAITASLDRYFDAINNRDYLAYRQLFIRAVRGGLSPAAFHAEFAATVDSGEQLHSIGVIGGGRG
jgi:hypothetical protein